MNEGLAVLFLLLVAVCALLAVVSLLTPKAAGLLRQKTRLRGFLAWLGLGLVFFVGTLVCVPKDGSSVFKTPPQVAQVPFTSNDLTVLMVKYSPRLASDSYQCS